MTQEGLSESAEMLGKCAQAMQMNSKRAETGRRTKADLNKNVNAINKMKNFAGRSVAKSNSNERSVETIYESVVLRRQSSSSEDDGNFNSSNELMGEELFSPMGDQIDILIAGEKHKRSRIEQGMDKQFEVNRQLQEDHHHHFHHSLVGGKMMGFK